jgi:hypothetical protein
MSTTFATLYAYAQRHLHNRSGAVAVALAKECTNRALRRIAENDHPHFIKQGYINLVAPYSSGTVAVAEGGTVVTGTNATWTSAMTNRYMKIDDEPVHFQLTSWVSATGFTFAGGAKWLNDSVTSGTYVIYKDTYDLPSDFRKTGSILEKTMLAEVEWISNPDDWHKRKMQNYTLTGPPQWVCMAESKLRVWPYETDISVLPFLYYYWPTDLSADADVMDFPDALIDLVRAAIRAEVAIERGKDEDATAKAYEEKRKDLDGAAAHPNNIIRVGQAGPRYGVGHYVIGDDDV